MLSVLIADGLLIHQTWVAIAPIAGLGSNLGRKSLLQVLYRNEIRYFAINIGIHIVAFGATMGLFADGQPAYTVVYDICDAVTSILVSQFLLELQAADGRIRAGGSQLSITNSRISSAVFHRVVGSMHLASLTPEEGDYGAVSGGSLFEDLAEGFAPEGLDEDLGKVVPDARAESATHLPKLSGAGLTGQPSLWHQTRLRKYQPNERPSPEDLRLAR